MSMSSVRISMPSAKSPSLYSYPCQKRAGDTTSENVRKKFEYFVVGRGKGYYGAPGEVHGIHQ